MFFRATTLASTLAVGGLAVAAAHAPAPAHARKADREEQAGIFRGAARVTALEDEDREQAKRLEALEARVNAELAPLAPAIDRSPPAEPAAAELSPASGGEEEKKAAAGTEEQGPAKSVAAPFCIRDAQNSKLVLRPEMTIAQVKDFIRGEFGLGAPGRDLRISVRKLPRTREEQSRAGAGARATGMTFGAGFPVPVGALVRSHGRGAHLELEPTVHELVQNSPEQHPCRARWTACLQPELFARDANGCCVAVEAGTRVAAVKRRVCEMAGVGAGRAADVGLIRVGQDGVVH